MDMLTVITCPSRRLQYTEATLDGLDRAGADTCTRLVCCDGPPEGPEGSLAQICRWPIAIKPDGPSGTRFIMWWTFRKALEYGADRLLYCEDDLIVSRDAVHKIRAMDIDDEHAFITFYDWKECPDPRTAAGLYTAPAMGFHNDGLYGSQCLLIPRRTIEWVTTRNADEWGDPWPHTKNGGDCVLTWAIRQSPWPRFAVHVPSLVDHAGVTSSIEPRRVRRSSQYIESMGGTRG